MARKSRTGPERTGEGKGTRKGTGVKAKGLGAKAGASSANVGVKNPHMLAWLAVVATFLVYIPALQNDFVPNWDDGGYVLEYEPIEQINAENMAEIWSTFYKGNYHPLTTTLYAIQYSIVGEEAFLYHLVNVLLHIINTFLVFLLIFRLLKQELTAFWAALIFGIHPMHVESVAWISELKDVLFAFFYLLSLLAYLKFRAEKKSKQLILSLLWFTLALFSKSAAVTLPLVVLLIDGYKKTGLNFRYILIRLPYFALALIFGIVAIMSQGKQGAIQDLTPLFSAVDRFFIVNYAIMTYILKFFGPVDLMAMYPYPGKIEGAFPWEVYAAPVGVLILAIVIIILARRSRIPAFGALFFIATSILTLQILPVGGAVVAERYTYIPYIGLSLVPVWLLSSRYQARRDMLRWQHILLTAFTIFLIALTIQRIPVWKNGLTLFTDVIEKNPELPFGYNNRGYAYQKYYGSMEKAHKDYSTAISLDSTYYQSLSNRGVVRFNTGNVEGAIKDFTRSLRYDPNNEDALLGRANSLSSLGRYAKAIPDYDRYLELVPTNDEAWLWRGVAYYNTQEFEKALADIGKSRSLNPDSDEGAYWEGLAAKSLGMKDKALAALREALALDPGRFDAAMLQGLIYYENEEYQPALKAFNHSIQLNPQYAPAYVNRAAVHSSVGNFAKAANDLQQARKLGYPVDEAYLRETMMKAGMITQ